MRWQRMEPDGTVDQPTVRDPSARYLQPMTTRATLADSCVLFDVLADDPKWVDGSIARLDGTTFPD